MLAKDLIVGKTYKLTFPNKHETVATLIKIETYPATGFPNDYIFKYVSGDDTLLRASRIKDCFPWPEKLIPFLTSIEEVAAYVDEIKFKMKNTRVVRKKVYKGSYKKAKLWS